MYIFEIEFQICTYWKYDLEICTYWLFDFEICYIELEISLIK